MKRTAVFFLAAAALAGCGKPPDDRVQGYVEGEFVYVASPIGGQLETLSTAKGAPVKKGDPLFVLESGAEQAQRAEAERKLAQARATLEDVKRGQRPSEIASLEARLRQARSAAVFSAQELDRQERLGRSGATAQQELERARSLRDQDRDRAAQLEADIETAGLGARADQITAAEETVRAQEAALALADWSLGQKRQASPVTGGVFDTIFRQGEWVPAGRPVVAVLPPENVKVRAFVPEGKLSAVRLGGAAKVFIDGMGEPLSGKVSFISPRAEFTPPVIYSQESRGKLVFMVELTFDAAAAEKLHPGQPADVEFAKP